MSVLPYYQAAGAAKEDRKDLKELCRERRVIYSCFDQTDDDGMKEAKMWLYLLGNRMNDEKS